MQNFKPIDRFIAEVVDGWMLGDLKRMVTEIKHYPDSAGNCNFPIALYTFTCIEFLGYLTSPTPIPDGQGSTFSRIWSYIDSFFSETYKQQLNPYRDRFVNIFRHGLAHEYFAKSAGVSRTHPKLLREEGGVPILDADRFYDAFRESVVGLKEAVNQDKEAIVERITTRYTAKQRGYTEVTTTTTTTSSSGASIAPKLQDIKQTTTLPPEPWTGAKKDDDSSS